MTNRTFLESLMLVGAVMLTLSIGLAITLSPWFLGLALGAPLALVGLAAILQSATKLRTRANLNAEVPGPPPSVIASLAGLLALAVPVVVHVKVGILSSPASVALLIASALVVVAAAVLAIRWSR
ncbi:hypothetical protein [uncultured Tessaracoccus sp.]|uniref:hypothetical protein n=1 Tax=uncultured Tessaracoccus sp. TaxID=905023 RepID=UPI00263110D2|nr:hypothetical protein [uncultured Tessaracoccus sp.]